MVGKRWVVQADDVCPLCSPLNGKVVPLDAPFADGVQHPPLHPRCRCSLEPVWADEALAKPAEQEPEDDPCAQFPGWVSAPTEPGYCYHTSGRTLFSEPHPLLNDYITSYEDLEQWWNSLSLTEKIIEQMLARTAGTNAAFAHIPEHTFDNVTGWVEENQDTIEEISAHFGVDPALVAGILASEMLYDYDRNDSLQDTLGVIPDAAGYANVHIETFMLAYRHLVQHYTGTDNPWLRDPNAPLPIGPEPFGTDPLMWPEPDEITNWRSRPWIGPNIASLGAYARTDEGAIALTAVVLRWLVDHYVADPAAEHDPYNLSPQDMAVIFAAYRGGIQGVSPEAPNYAFPEGVIQFQNWLRENPLGDNASLAYPLMLYSQDIFDGNATPGVWEVK